MKVDMTSDHDIETIIKSMVDYEGFEIGEAELLAPVRAELPANAFCGPNRTFPSYDSSKVKKSLVNLEKYGYRLSKLARERIRGELERKRDDIMESWYLRLIGVIK